LALIELDLAAPPDPRPGSRPPVRHYRVTGLILAAVLLLAPGGASTGAPTLWRYLGAVPAPSGTETLSRLAGDRVYTMTTADSMRIATAWQAAKPPRKLWTIRLAARVAGPDAVGYGGLEARPAGDVVLLSDGPQTTVVDATTGAVRWSSPVGVTPLPGGRIGYTQTQVFRPGTTYDQDSGAPGPLYFSATGEPHTEPPVRTEIDGLDLRTGKTVWTSSAPGSINVFTAPGAAPAVLVLASDRLERLDGATGATQRSVPLPRVGADGPAGGTLTDGLLVVRYGDFAFDGQEAGYAADSLAKRWQRPVGEVLLDPPDCGDLLCAGPRDALDVLDPATGRAAWRAPAQVDLDERNGLVLERLAHATAPLRLADRATGATRLDLTGWAAALTAGDGEPLVLRRSLPGGKSAFGVVLHGRVQLLGVSAEPATDCAADGRYVLCRGHAGLEIWAYSS